MNIVTVWWVDGLSISILSSVLVQLSSGLTRGGVLNGELYAQRLQKSIYLLLFTDCFMKICLQSWEQIYSLYIYCDDWRQIFMYIFSDDWRQIFMKQFVNKSR